MNTKIKFYLIFVLIITTSNLHAQRVPVLNQIDLPHNYYFREMYLPQLTSGPSSACWANDSIIVFSMAGSLWKQNLNSNEAEQLTDTDGYDYQPDCSPDGKKIIFVKYNGTSDELMLLDLVTNKIYPLTNNNAVNVEPRWSPNGKEILFVSTINTKHFLLYKANVESNAINGLKCITPDKKSKVKRYYYSEYDHAINPTWSADGKRIYFISNNEIAHGTGDLVFINTDADTNITSIKHEETEWNTRPDVSPDNSRIIYSSYLGSNFQQLWMLPLDGGYPVPLTYGEYDNTYPRWSPDGKKIIFISNREGNTSLWLLNTFDGGQQKITTSVLKYLTPRKNIFIKVVDEQGEPLPARISVTDSAEKFYAPQNEWINADDSRFVPMHTLEAHYFITENICNLSVPKEKLLINVKHGYLFNEQNILFDASANDTCTIILKKFTMPYNFQNFWSGDLHVHMNYGGHYLNTPANLVKQAEAEDVNFVYNLIVNKEQRLPDIKYFSSKPDAASTAKTMLLHAQEFHTSFWGHLGLLHLSNNFILPAYAGYPQTALASIFPNNSFIADAAHKQNGLVGYAHPFEQSQIFPKQAETLSNELPVDAALSKVDYYELVGFSDHKASEFVWYKLLNCGLHIPAAAGTDAMENYASLRGPVGLNRVYVNEKGTLNEASFLKDIKEGKSFVTNGPLIGLEVNEKTAGDSLFINEKGSTFTYKAFLRSNIEIDSFEIIFNGDVLKKFTVTGNKKIADESGTIFLQSAGWLLLRAWSNQPKENLFDIYPYASTNPIYINGPQKYISKNAATYFVEWTNRLENIANNNSTYRNEAEKNAVINDILNAKKIYQHCLQTATGE